MDKVRISRDQYNDCNPRIEYDHVFSIVQIAGNSRYCIGDKDEDNRDQSVIDFMLYDSDCEHLGYIPDIYNEHERLSDKQLARLTAEFKRHYVAYEVYHNEYSSELSIDENQLHADNDSCPDAIVYCSVDRLKSEGIHDYHRCARAEIEEFSAYLSGDVWHYEIIRTEHCSCCDSESEEIVDSCAGFLGRDSIIEHLKSEYPQIEVIDNEY